jgi:hypothetical protein
LICRRKHNLIGGQRRTRRSIVCWISASIVGQAAIARGWLIRLAKPTTCRYYTYQMS